MDNLVGNVGVVCPEHAPKPNPNLAQMKPTSFIGSWVKAGFPTGNGEQLEFMWAKITSCDDRVLVGTLDNDPVLVTGLKCGDQVRINLDKVCDVMRDNTVSEFQLTSTCRRVKRAQTHTPIRGRR